MYNFRLCVALPTRYCHIVSVNTVFVSTTTFLTSSAAFSERLKSSSYASQPTDSCLPLHPQPTASSLLLHHQPTDSCLPLHPQPPDGSLALTARCTTNFLTRTEVCHIMVPGLSASHHQRLHFLIARTTMSASSRPLECLPSLNPLLSHKDHPRHLQHISLGVSVFIAPKS